MHLPPQYRVVTRPLALRLSPALAALAAALLLGCAGPARPGAWQALDSAWPMAVTGLLLAGAAGLFACHLAQLTARASASPALLAALVAGALPGLSMASLLIPLGAGVYTIWRVGPRPAILLGLAAALAGMAATGLDSPVLGTAASLAMLASAALLLRRQRPGNDDHPIRFGEFWNLPEDDTQAARAASPGLGE